MLANKVLIFPHHEYPDDGDDGDEGYDAQIDGKIHKNSCTL